jgi:SPP1 gp7 family putative phage head morphogenesis protein
MITVTTYKKQERVDYKSLIVVNKATQNYDPTRTTVLRSQFMKDFDRRFSMLTREIKKAIIEDDIFGLIEPKHDLIKIITVNETPGKEAFKFSTSQDKVSQFMKWLKLQEKKGLLNTTTINTSGEPIEKAWTDMYISDSYKRGVTRARYEMGSAGMGTPGIEETGGISAAMSTPFHMDRVGMLYARTFEDLKGITAAMDSNISRILSQGMVDGDGPRSLAGKIVDATGISRNRTMTLARTEIIRAHHSAMVQEYKNWAVEGVVVKAEWVDAGFNVCPKCAENNGKIFELSEIEGLIPLHPNCRCIALPTMPEKGVKTVETVQTVSQKSFDLANSDFYYASDKEDKNKSLEHQTILSYIGRGYKRINKVLRKNIMSPVDLAYQKNLEIAIEKLPKFEGTVFRGVRDLTGQRLQEIKDNIGGELEWKGFISTSREKRGASYFAKSSEKGIIYRIKSYTGRDLAGIAPNTEEAEILFKSGTKFKIIGIKTENYTDFIDLEEIL